MISINNIEPEYLYYFEKYTALIIKFDGDIPIFKFKNILRLINEIFYNIIPQHFIYHITNETLTEDENQFYVSIYRLKNSLIWGWYRMGYLPIDVENNNYIYDEIFDYNKVNTKEKLTRILRTGTYMPTYEPKKIERTLESHTKLDLCEEYVFKCENDKESEELQSDLFKNGFRWNYTKQYYKFDSYPVYIFCDLKGKELSHMTFESSTYHGDINKYIKKCNEGGDHICTKIWNYSQVNYVLSRFRNSSPNYKPRKMEKISENKSINEKYKMVILKIENINDKLNTIKKLKDLGYSWYTPSDEVEYYNDNNFPIWLIIYSDKNILSLNDYDFNRIGVNKLISNISSYYYRIIKPNEINLISHIFNQYAGAPDYQPKQIKRMLESVEFKAENTKYFQKYNAFIVSFDIDMNIETYERIANMLKTMFGDVYIGGRESELPTFSENNCHTDFYLSFEYTERNDWDFGWCYLDFIKSEDNLNGRIFPKIYNYKEVNTLDKLKNILNTGGISVPSYNPRNIKRDI